jgi:hypothetical protein
MKEVSITKGRKISNFEMRIANLSLSFVKIIPFVLFVVKKISADQIFLKCFSTALSSDALWPSWV